MKFKLQIQGEYSFSLWERISNKVGGTRNCGPLVSKPLVMQPHTIRICLSLSISGENTNTSSLAGLTLSSHDRRVHASSGGSSRRELSSFFQNHLPSGFVLEGDGVGAVRFVHISGSASHPDRVLGGRGLGMTSNRSSHAAFFGGIDSCGASQPGKEFTLLTWGQQFEEPT
jgi:hypothetical protein